MKFLLLLIMFLMLIISTEAQNLTCPSDAELDAAIESCEDDNKTGIYYADEQDCLHIVCAVERKACPDETMLNISKNKCSLRGLRHTEHVDEAGCNQAVCSTPLCFSERELQESITLCSVAGQNWSYAMNEHGCKTVRCVQEKNNEVTTRSEKREQTIPAIAVERKRTVFDRILAIFRNLFS